MPKSVAAHRLFHQVQHGGQPPRLASGEDPGRLAAVLDLVEQSVRRN